MKKHIGLALALASLTSTCDDQHQSRPRVEVRHVICNRCGGTERTGCSCEHVNAAACAKAVAKGTRKNAERLVQFARQRAGQPSASV